MMLTARRCFFFTALQFVVITNYYVSLRLAIKKRQRTLNTTQMRIIGLIVLLLIMPFYVQAETPQPSYMPPPSIASTEGMLKMVAGLLLVLAIIGAIAWALKRFAFHPSTASGAIKIIASAAVGQRERIVLVEVENTRLVLGVAPGRVNTLHCIDRSSAKLSNDTLPESNSSKFQEQLNQST